jgi:hypothetical protein
VLGPPKGGKSQLAAHLVTCLLTEHPVFGHYAIIAERPPRTLWLMAEETRYKPRMRVEANLRGFGWSDDEIGAKSEFFDEHLVISGRDNSSDRQLRDSVFSIEHHLAWLRELARSGEFDVIVLDSLRPAHEREENSSTEMLPVTSLMRELSGEVCLLILHHTGHASVDGPRLGGDAARGTTDLDAARDTAIHLRQGSFGGPMLLGFHHRDDAQAFVAVQTTADRERQLATWQRLDASDDPAEARRALAAVQLLARVDAAQGPEDLPRRTDAKNLIGNHYKEILDSLERDAVIEIRKFRTGKQGNIPQLIMRRGQFTPEQWQAAEQRAQETV